MHCNAQDFPSLFKKKKIPVGWKPFHHLNWQDVLGLSSVSTWCVRTRSRSVSAVTGWSWTSSVGEIPIIVSITVRVMVMRGMNTGCWSAHVDSWSWCVGPFCNGIIYSNTPAVKFHPICTFLCFFRVFNVFKIDKRKSSWSSCPLVIDHIDSCEWSISGKHFTQLPVSSVQAQAKHADTIVRIRVGPVSNVTPPAGYGRVAAASSTPVHRWVRSAPGFPPVWPSVRSGSWVILWATAMTTGTWPWSGPWPRSWEWCPGSWQLWYS